MFTASNPVKAEYLVAAGVKNPEPWLAALEETFKTYRINTPQQVAAWIAQTAHESSGFAFLVENLNYSSDGLAAVWPGRFAEKGSDGGYVKINGKNKPNALAIELHRKPEQIANVVYAGRMGNGPAESGDGWKYRGRGLKQLTGKDNYSRCGQAIGRDLIRDPDLLLSPQYAALSAGWFWDVNRCGALADAGDFVGLTRRINGGTIGLEDRQRRYDAVMRLISPSPV